MIGPRRGKEASRKQAYSDSRYGRRTAARHNLQRFKALALLPDHAADRLKAAGIRFVDFSAADKATINQAMRPVGEQWAK